MADADRVEVTELLPCPFCGGEARLYENPPYEPPGMFFVRCDPCDLVYDKAWDVPRDQAIAAWNTRQASTAALQERVKRMEQQLAEAKRPDLFWCDADPEAGYIDVREAMEADLGWDAEGGVAVIREGKQLGVRYYAILPAADDSDSDDEWEAIFDSKPAADAAIAAERARRATLTNGAEA